MGQKVKATGLRLKINSTWKSRWYNKKNYANFLHVDLKVRNFLEKELKAAGVARILIERPTKANMRVIIEVARPGPVIGPKGAGIEKVKKELEKLSGVEVSLNIVEVKKPEIIAKLISENVADQLEKRVSFRRAMKRAVQSCLRMGAKGIRINCAGRLAGAEIARTEWYREGRVPLHTLRADIDYHHAEALTTYGIIGVKVWVYRGDIMEHDPYAQDRLLKEFQTAR